MATYSTTPLNIVSGGNDLGVLVNSLAYNPQDGYLYALSTPGSNGGNANSPVYLYKIGQGGIVQLGIVKLGNATTNLALTPATGTFDKVGNYYFTSQNTNTNNGGTDYNLYKLVPGGSSPLLATRTAFTSSGTSTITMYDMAFNPIDGFLYGANTVGSLFKLDPSSAAISTITTGAGQAVGTVFFDIAGNLYTYSNGTVGTANSANFYQVNLTTGAYTLISSIDPASVSDGASCINPGSSIDVNKELTNVRAVNAYTFDISYSIRVRNTYTATLTNVQVSDILKGNVSTSTNVPFPTATSITLVTAPAVTNYDGATLVANPNFNGLSAATTGTLGGGALLDGAQSLTAGQRALITYTVRVQFGTSSANVPTSAQNNTAYATSTSSSPNKGYTLTSTDVLLTPNDLVANDASTNSANFPALRTTLTNGTPNAVDTSSPTPVAFAPSISGVVFEDVSYGGGAGRSQAASNGVSRSGVRVELFNNGSYSSFTTTAGDGSYSFTGLSAGNYTVRVLSNGVTSSRNTGNATGLVGVQTFRTSYTAATGTVGDPNRVGGEYPAWTEAINGSSGATITSINNNAATAGVLSTAAVTLSAGIPAAGVDFGYNFDTVVNTNNTGQGSLRQFIANANALDNTNLDQDPASSGGSDPVAGVETSIFMIPNGAAHDGLTAYNASTNPGLISQLTNGVAAINITSVLPTITGTYSANTSIDATTQTQNVGDTNTAVLGTGGTVGTAGTPLAQVNGPEVQLKGTRAFNGLTVGATNTTIRGLSIYGFTNNIYANTDVTNTLIELNVIGTTATSFTDPGANVRTLNQGINLNGSDSGTIQNNLIAYSGGMGIWVQSNGTNGANNNTITGNELRGNAQETIASPERLVFDGLELQGNSTGNLVAGNLITASLGHGIDSYGNALGGNTITGNTISNNGVGVANNTGEEGSGLRIYGATNTTTISNNVLSGNNGSGVLVENTAAKVVISQNSIFGNTRVGIDLVTNANISAAAANEYNGTTGSTSNVTLNSTTTTGGNALLNYPIITSATVVGPNLLVQGYAKSGAAIELFIAQANASAAATPNDKFGQGATYLATLTEGSTNDTNTLTGQSYTGTINGVNQGADTNANGFSFLVPLTSAQQAAITSGTLLTSTATLGGATSEFSGNAAATVTAPLTGYVYEDVNYGGGAGRSRTTAGTSAVTRPGAKVELYDSNGAYVSTAITDANGQYSFNAVPGSYTVRVVNNSVLSSRGQAASTYSGDATNGYLNTLLPVQTYNGTTTRVGGQNPAYSDALANTGTQTLASLTSGTTTPESIATVTVTQGASTNTGADFGFNFDTVVNTKDVAVSGNNTQGTLRQFILNSNALTGTASLAQSGSNTSGTLPAARETSIFMIPDGLAHAGLLASTNGGPANQLSASGVAVITPTTALPAITAANTSIDGTTQTQNIGNTNNVTLGAGGTVGTAATTLSTVNGPEVQITGNSAIGVGLDVASTGTNTTIRGLAVLGFGNALDNNANANIRSAANGLTIAQNVLGSVATTFTQPASPTNADNVRLLTGTSGISISNNLIGFSNSKGIAIGGSVTNVSVTNNEIRSNGLQGANYDGIDIQGNNATISGNLLTGTSGQGVDSYRSTGSNTISGNTITDNGRGTATITPFESPGVRIYGANNTISQNIISNNYGAGIMLEGTNGSSAAVSTTTISQNSIFGNGSVTARNGNGVTGQVGIDLQVTGDNESAGSPNFVTLNSTTTTGANTLINYPILTSATVVGTNLVLKGYAKAGVAIELFLAQANANGPSTASPMGNNFGQGKTYLTTLTEGATTGVTDTDGSTGQTYGAAGATINGFAQGTDTNANGFTFTIPLTAAQQALVLAGVKLTATSTLSSATSEFSGIVNVNTAPVPNTLTNVNIPNNAAATVLNPNLSATANGTFNGNANSIGYYTLTSLPTSGTLTYNGTVLTSANIAATQITPALLNTLTYTPVSTFSGNVSFTYTATDANGVTSTTNNNGGTVTSGPATYTIPVVQSADLTANLTGGTTLSSGQPTGYYTATFTNLGPNGATNVTQSVTLPTGASLTTAQQNAITTAYSGTTFSTTGSGTSAVTTITFPAATTLASGAANSYRFAFTAPTTAGSSTIAANIASTTTNEGANVAPNTASLALTTTGLTDVQATITASAATVAPGSAATFTATITNNSTQAAAGVVATVQLPVGLTPTSVSGQAGTLSGTTVTYPGVATLNTTTGLLSYTVNTLAGSSNASSAIVFTMPTSGIVTGTASITTTTPESNTTNNVASASITAGPQFDLATSISGPTAVVAGSPVTLNVTTTNNGPQAVAGAVETVQLPANLNTTGAPNVFISNGGTYDNNSGVVTFPALGTLPSGQTVANTITFIAPTSAFSPVATVTPNTTAAGETNTANNTAYLNNATSTAGAGTLTPSGATTATANVYAILSTTSNIVAANSQVTYTVGVGNAGPSTATTVTGRLQLIPSLGTTTLTVGGSAGTVSGTGASTIITYTNGAVYSPATGLLTYPGTASLASGSTSTFAVVVTVPSTVGNNGQLLATASVASATSDVVPGDNVKAVAVTVQPIGDLATTIAGPTSGVVPGQSVTYTATFTNNGPDAASVTAETVQLPAGLTTTTLTVGGQTGTLSGTTITFASGATYSTTTGIVTLPAIASDAPGAVQAFNLTFTAPAQSYVVSSAVSSATPDSAPANNAASVATTVTSTADVAIAIAGPATVVAGNPVTYIVTATNNGPVTATGIVSTVQLPTGLTILASGTGSPTYDSSTGLLTFPAIANLQPGVSAESYVTFTMPNATGGQLSALASISSTTNDNVASNNTAALTTSVAPATTTTADLLTSITPTGTSVAPGSTVVYTVAYRNGGTSAATNVVPTASLPTGLSATALQVGGVTGTLANGVITFTSGPASGATYEVATGLLTFPTIGTLAVSGTATSYSVSFPAPASGQLVVYSAVNSSTTESNLTNNRANSSISITSAFDLTTSITGPASALVGAQNVYTVTSINNGPSMVSSATQTVTLPNTLTTSTLLVAGQAGTLSGSTISYPNGASYNTSSGVLTFAAISNLAPGASAAVTNTITVTMPSSGTLTAQASITTAATGETNTANNSNSITTVTSTLSIAPVAENIVNNLQTPQGNTAVALPISPLYATDADGTVSFYTITSLPTAAQGVLYYNNNPVTLNQTITAANANLLSFDPANTFVGNAFFTYTATDNNSVVSNTALYTIPVAADIASTYTAYNTTKGGSNKYVTGDVLAQITDLNTATYTSGGIIYNATTGVLQSGAANGLPTSGTNATLPTTGPAGNTSNTLPAGVSLDPATGRIYVSNASQLVNYSTARTYSVYVITTDINGGINQVLSTFTIGAYPLPVVLTDFTATAVRNRDALLTWATASEKNNDHFDIERSFDGTSFAKIGQVAGHGTTTTASAYSLTDANVAAKATGPVYYRLRQVDLDGSASYSPVRSVRFTASTAPVSLSLYPNPAQASTTLDLSQLPATGTYQVVLLDATGRTVRATALGGGLTQPLDVHELASGSYLLLVTGQQPDGSPLKQTLRLTKE